MANYLATDTDLTAVANAIRTKGGTSAQLTFPQGFVDAIAAISGGGGSSAVQLLDTIEVSSNVRAVTIDTTPFNAYDIYFCIIDAELTGSDWMYVAKDSTTGGIYAQKVTNPKGIIFAVIKSYAVDTKYTLTISHNTITPSVNPPNSMYVYAYTSSIQIKAGSKFRIYGGNYADM